MNERIKELMVEAFQSHYGDPVTQVAREKAIELVSGWGEKFAELIVRECAEFAEQKYGNWYRVNAPGDSPSIAIKQYFGVE